MAIKRDGVMYVNFASETRLEEGDTILVLGDTKNLQNQIDDIVGISKS